MQHCILAEITSTNCEFKPPTFFTYVCVYVCICIYMQTEEYLQCFDSANGHYDLHRDVELILVVVDLFCNFAMGFSLLSDVVMIPI